MGMMQESVMMPSEIMFAAAEEVGKGWCKDVLEDRDGNVCALGAIERVHRQLTGHGLVRGLSGMAWVCIGTLGDILMEQRHSHNISSWNNAPDTTQDDVITMMQKVAIALQEKGQ